MNIIKKKITRIIAGILSCIFIGIFFGNLTLFISEKRNFYNDYEMQNSSISIDINDIYYKLWLVGAMWLRNLDENGNFKGTDELKSQTVSVLKELGCMDKNGNISIDGFDDYEYMAAYGNNKFSNTSKNLNQISDKFTFKRENDFIESADYYFCNSIGDWNIYDVNYGMHYYEMPGKSIALFDYDITGLDSYIDEMGANIYYKKDGSTPMPGVSYNYYIHNDVYYYYEGDYVDYVYNMIEGTDSYDNEEYDSNVILDEVPEKEDVPRGTFDNDLYMHDSETDSFVKVDNENDNKSNEEPQIFIKTHVPEYPLTIAIRPSDELAESLQSYHDKIEMKDKDNLYSVLNHLPLIIIAFVLAVYVLIMGGYNLEKQKFCIAAPDKVFAEVYIGLGGIAFACGLWLIDAAYEFYDFFEEYYSANIVPNIYGMICSVLFGVILLALNSLIVRIKCHTFWKYTLTWTIITVIFGWIKKLYSCIIRNCKWIRNDKITKRFITHTVIFAIAGAILNMFLLAVEAFVLAFFVDTAIVIIYSIICLKDLKSINNINKHITAISEGDYTPRTEPVTSYAYNMTQKLNNISSGIQNAVDRQVKSERMKIDLVTNVSHDLKTPLTSIISYIDLLSDEKLSPAAKDYVAIINNKSQRLKSMVEDLFDLAKATSRTDIDMEKIDAVILVNQVAADLSDKIERSNKQVKLNITPDSAMIMAEGKKMYRVIQNLIDNALKYSLDNTRIYINLVSESGYCIIKVKNIASYEMNFEPSEIMERFTRGDESRSTDGNGLGLSIAKNFTEAYGGMFDISIDGDMFIAEIKIPIIF